MRSCQAIFLLSLLLTFPARAEQASPFTSESPAMVFSRVSALIVLIRASGPRGTVQGSGVVIGKDLVATNLHVVAGATSIGVTFKGEEQLATVRATTNADKDLALLSVDTGSVGRVVTRRSSELTVGERVFAIGNPRGYEQTLTEGLVSALRKDGDAFVVQTSAAISPGSSGGGLFDTRGRLIGITTKTRVDGQSLNFAHPVEWLEALKQKGPATPPVVGFSQPAFSVTARPAAVLCELTESARWGLFSEGPELLETRSTSGSVLLVGLDTTQPSLDLKATPLVLKDLSRKQQVALFSGEGETVFVSFDDDTIRVTLAWVVPERGEPRLLTRTGRCESGAPDVLTAKIKTHRSTTMNTSVPREVDCEKDPGGCYAAARSVAGGERFVMMKKACRSGHRQACDEAIELAAGLNDTVNVDQLEKLRKSARVFDVVAVPDGGTPVAPAPVGGARRPLKTH
jgi:hypothetical protein